MDPINIDDYLEKMTTIHSIFIEYLQNHTDLEEGFKNIIIFFNENNITSNKCIFKEILHLIVKIANNMHRSPSFFLKINKIILFCKTEIQNFFTNFQIFNIFKSNKRILLFLIEQKIVIPDNQISNIITKEKYYHKNYPQYFYPEFKSFYSAEILKKIEKFTQNIDDSFEKNRENEFNGYINRIIQQDLVNEFILYSGKVQKSFLTSTIGPSIFETNPFLFEKSPTLIEYAAFFGSFQIIKNLFHSGVELTESIFIYAIHSNNAELIHFLEENLHFDNDDYILFYKESLKCHHSDLANYFKENYLSDFTSKYLGELQNIFKYRCYDLFENEIDINSDNFDMLCKYDYIELVKKILSEKHDLNEIMKNRCLNFAARKGNIEIVKLLLKRQEIDINRTSVVKLINKSFKKRKIESTVLYEAVESDNIEMVKFLLSYPNIDVNNKSFIAFVIKNDDGSYIVHENEDTPLKAAISNENIEMVNLLLSYPQIDVNEIIVEKVYKLYGIFCSKSSSTYTEHTVIHNAAEKGNLSIFKLLFSRKDIDVNATKKIVTKKMKDEYIETKEEKSALFIAFDNNHNDIVKSMLSSDKTNVNTTFLYYSEINTLIYVKDKKEEESNREEIYNDENNLFFDEEEGFFEEEEFIEEEEKFEKYEEITIDKNYKVSKKHSIKIEKTLLYRAIERQDFKVIEMILNTPKYDMNSLSFIGKNRITALNLAIDKNYIDIVILLLSSKEVNSNAFSFYSPDNEITPLYLSILENNIEMVKLLISYDTVDVNCFSILGNAKKTPLYLAIENENNDIIDILLSHDKIDINKKSLNYNEKKTVLNKAIENENYNIIQLLLAQKNLDVNAVSSFDGSEKSPLYFAVEKNFYEIVQLLLGREDTDANFNFLYLHYNRNFEELESDLSEKESIKRKVSTPLLTALKKGYKEVANLLLKRKNIDINAKYWTFKSVCIKSANNAFRFIEKRKEKTALHLAAEKGYQNIVDLLLEKKKN